MLAVLDEADSLNRNYLPVTSDSLLKEATHWFDSHGSANERVRTHYLLGCAYRDKGEAPAALQSYHDAVDCADTTATDCDYGLLSRVHGQMADLFYEQYMPKEQIVEISKAISYSERCNDTLSAIKFMEFSASAYELSNNVDSMLSIYKNSIKKYLSYNYIEEAYRCYEPLIDIYIDNDSIQTAGKFIADYKKTINNPSLLFFYIEGKYFLKTNNIQEAYRNFRNVLEESESINDSLLASQGLYEVFKNKNIVDSTLYYAEQVYNLTTNEVKTLETETLEKNQSLYNYSRHQQIALEKSKEVSKFKSILFVVILCVICALYCAISIILKYNQERREKEKQHKSDVQELLLLKNEIEKLSTANLSLIIEEKTKRIHELQSKIDEYQTKNYKKLSDVDLRLTKSEIYKHFRDYCLTPHKSEITVADWDTIVELINNEVPTFFQLLTINTQSLRKLDIYLCVLVRLHFQPKDISIILDISQSEVSVLRRRLLKKIFNCKGSAKDFDKKIQSISD